MSSASRAAASTALRYPVPAMGTDDSQEELSVSENAAEPEATENNAAVVETSESFVFDDK